MSTPPTIHTDPITGIQYRWDGQQWQPLPPGPPMMRRKHTGRNVAVGIAALLVLASIGSAVGLSGGSKHAATPATSTSPSAQLPADTQLPGETPSAVETPTPADTAPPADAGPTIGKFGVTESFTSDDGSAWNIVVTRPRSDKSFDDGYTTPSPGNVFVSLKIKVTATAGNVDYNEFDWYVRNPDGGHLDGTMGLEPWFSSGTLHTGETVTGYLTYDSPGHGALVYDPNTFGGTGSLAEWKF